MGRVELKPPVVTVSGEAAVIKSIAYVETEPLDLKGATEPISRTLRLVTPRSVDALGAQQVTVTVEIVKG
jgi:YbbR domain-containing protein